MAKSPPRPGAHNAIIADLAMPVVPAPRGGRTWLRGVLVVGDRRRVGDPLNRCWLRRAARQAAADDPRSIAAV